jgi:hypothetical protein
LAAFLSSGASCNPHDVAGNRHSRHLQRHRSRTLPRPGRQGNDDHQHEFVREALARGDATQRAVKSLGIRLAPCAPRRLGLAVRSILQSSIPAAECARSWSGPMKAGEARATGRLGVA